MKRRIVMGQYNPYDNVLKVVKEAADILGYSDSDIEMQQIS